MPNTAGTITIDAEGRALTAVVPATDAPPTLGRCLAAIDRAAEAPDEVLVVERAAGAGPAAARNEGLRRATGDIVCFVDADVEVRPDAFARMRRRFAEAPDLAALFGSYDDAPAASGIVSQFRNLLHHHVHQSSPGRAHTFWAGLGAIRRHRLLEAGGFDSERFPTASVEDVELGRRLTARGLHVELDPSIQGKHLKRWTLGSMVATDFARRAVPWVRLELERPTGRDLNLGVRHRLSAVASLAAVVAAGRGRGSALGAATLVLLALNASFYLLLARRLGARAALGPPLHAVHHLTALAAVPVAAAAHVRAARGGRT
jgi:GT2 family glycosyltransferase